MADLCARCSHELPDAPTLKNAICHKWQHVNTAYKHLHHRCGREHRFLLLPLHHRHLGGSHVGVNYKWFEEDMNYYNEHGLYLKNEHSPEVLDVKAILLDVSRLMESNIFGAFLLITALN
jgi:hypothetical protein